MVKIPNEIFIIGGEQIYKSALPLATNLYITRVDGDFDGDAFFPHYEQNEWKEVGREDLISEKKIKFSFLKYERK